MIAENIHAILKEIGTAKLVVVTKKRSDAELREVYKSGQRLFGENKVQEMVAKRERLPEDIEWHFIGHLQRNKVKYISPFVSLIQSVDSIKLAREIDREARRNKRIIPVLLQIHIAVEEHKFGFDMDELRTALENSEFAEMDCIEVQGLMGMASNVQNDRHILEEFTRLKSFYLEIQNRFTPSLSILSMGMSGDYPLALRSGANLIRVGSKVFD